MILICPYCQQRINVDVSASQYDIKVICPVCGTEIAYSAPPPKVRVGPAETKPLRPEERHA